MNEEYIANAERRRKIADDMAWSSGYAAGRAAGLRLREAAQAVVDRCEALEQLNAALRLGGGRTPETALRTLDRTQGSIAALRAALAAGDEP